MMKNVQKPGQLFTIRDVLQTVDAETLRFFIVRAHYRSALNYGVDPPQSARTGLRRLYTAVSGQRPNQWCLIGKPTPT